MQIDYVSILASSAVSLFIGILWYGPFLFGRVWLRIEGLSGRNEEEVRAYRRKVLSMCGAQAFAVLLQIFILTVFIHATEEMFSWSAVTLLLWFGFVIPMHISAVVWDNIPRGMRFNKFFINVMYYLVIMMLSGYMITHWGTLLN